MYFNIAPLLTFLKKKKKKIEKFFCIPFLKNIDNASSISKLNDTSIQISES